MVTDGLAPLQAQFLVQVSVYLHIALRNRAFLATSKKGKIRAYLPFAVFLSLSRKHKTPIPPDHDPQRHAQFRQKDRRHHRL